MGSEHETSVRRYAPNHHARCSCGWHGRWHGTQEAAEADAEKHLARVTRPEEPDHATR